MVVTKRILRTAADVLGSDIVFYCALGILIFSL